MSTRRTAPKTSARLALVTSLVPIVVLAAIACSGTSSSSVRPTTGVVVRAETLTTGRGCGRSPSNLFKYAVVVFGYTSGDELEPSSYQTPITANVFDCFADGAFIDLETTAGSPRFRLEVYAYNEPSFTASREAIEAAGTNTALLETTAPTWTTECTATQQRDVQTLALCAALAPGLSGLGRPAPPTRISLATSTFHLADGRVASCATEAPPDAGAEADASALDASLDSSSATDAEAGPPVDAGAPVIFTTARVRLRRGATPVGDAIDVPCPRLYTADVPAEPARYDIDVGLLDGQGPVGQAVCSVTTRTGAVSSAVCP